MTKKIPATPKLYAFVPQIGSTCYITPWVNLQLLRQYRNGKPIVWKTKLE